MGKLINLVRPDGSILQASEDDAKQLMAYGYKEEGLEERQSRAVEAGREAYYSTPGEKLKTAIEGFGSGVTLGLSDKMLEYTTDAGITGDEWRSRSEYNPGTRLGSELVGAVAPAFFSGGTLTPAGALTEGANIATRGIEGVVARGAARGAVEGAGFGLGAEISHSALTGDPMTVEGTLAGMGWGAVWGGGLGAIGGKLESRMLKKAGVEADAVKTTSLMDDSFGDLRAALKEGGQKADDAFRAVETELDAQVAADKLAKHNKKIDKIKLSNEAKTASYEEQLSRARQLEENQAAIAGEKTKIEGQRAARDAFMSETEGRANEVFDRARSIRDGAFNEPWTEQLGMVKADKKLAIEAYNEMKTALGKRDWAAFNKAAEKFETRLADFNTGAKQYHYMGGRPIEGGIGKFEWDPSKIPGVDEPSIQKLTFPNTPKAPTLKPLPVENTQLTGIKDAFNQIKDLGATSMALKSFAESPHGFVNMSPSRFEKLAGSLETFLAHPAAELKGTQEAIKTAIARMQESVGIMTEGNPVAQLRGTWEHLRAAKAAKGVGTAAEMAEGKMPWMKKVAVAGGGVAAAKATGTGWLGYAAGRSIVSGLLGVKGAVLGAISDSVSKWAPRAQKAIRYLGSQGEPLMVRLDGTMDLRDKRKSQQELMMERAKEIREAAPTIRDTLYKQLAPLNTHFPEYAAALHEQAVNQFTFLYNKLPRDNGQAFNRLESLQKPDPIETAKFGRYWEVFQNPTKTVTDALSGKRVSPEAAEGLSNMWPALFTHMRSALFYRFMEEPKLLASMQYDDQVQMSLLTGLRMHSTLTAQFISQQQQMFTQRAKPLEMPPQPGAPGSAGGRPNTDSPYATPAQRSTER